MHSKPNDISTKIYNKEYHDSFEPPSIIDQYSSGFYSVPTFYKCSQSHCYGEDNEQDCHYSGREQDRSYFILHLEYFKNDANLTKFKQLDLFKNKQFHSSNVNFKLGNFGILAK